jgi:Ca2+-dependent lipid-binding protein
MQLHIKGIKAEGLPSKDAAGKSDPYTIFQIREREATFRTEAQSNTSTPSWSEEFTIPIPSVGTAILYCRVVDKDAVADDQIGQCDIQVYKLPPGQPVTGKYPLVNRKTKAKAGTLSFEVHLAPTSVPKWAPVPFVLQAIRLQVVEARNIPKQDTVSESDPYCVLTVVDAPGVYQTAVKDDTANPVWNEAFDIFITDPAKDKLHFVVMDKDVSNDDEVGTLDVLVSSLAVHVDQWYPLVPAKGVKKPGELHLVVDIRPAPQEIDPPSPGYIGPQ